MGDSYTLIQSVLSSLAIFLPFFLRVSKGIVCLMEKGMVLFYVMVLMEKVILTLSPGKWSHNLNN